MCICFVRDDAADARNAIRDYYPKALLTQDDETLAHVFSAVCSYLDGEITEFNFALDMPGTELQQATWEALTRIPYGQTVSYQELALSAGKPKAIRAVASACGANPVGLIVPCHRVIRRDGSLGGYRWGLERKTKILQLEQRLAKAA